MVTDLDGAAGIVRWSTVVAAAGDADVRITLRDEAGAVVAEGAGTEGELRVADATLWRPGAAYLYELTVDLVDGDRLVDRYRLPVGIRTVQVDGARFLINGEPFYFRGFGMHEDLAVRGRGHDDVAMVHDFELLTWLGANSFRTSHYPYAEEVLDMADRLGFVVIDETAAVGLNLGVAGGLFGDGARVDLQRRDGRTGARRRCTGRPSRSSSPATRTTPRSCSGASPTSPSPTPRSPGPTSSRCSKRPARPTRHGRSGS